MLSPIQASSLLELMIYERVLECIDLDALYRVEQGLMSTVSDVVGVSLEQASYAAKSMIDRSLLRLPSHARSYLRVVEALHCDDCEGDPCSCS